MTHTSQVPLTVEVSLPRGTREASSQYRSTNDPSLQLHKRFLIVDTPGHGKLRYHASEQIVTSQNLRGIMFIVDAADLAPDSSGLRDAAEYLHDILLMLQKRLTLSKTSKASRALPVLITANKTDLFTALPAPAVKSVLEKEINRIRASRAKGLLDSGIGMSYLSSDPEKDWVGDAGNGDFNFMQMAEVDVQVNVVAGSLTASQQTNVLQSWEWLASNL